MAVVLFKPWGSQVPVAALVAIMLMVSASTFDWGRCAARCWWIDWGRRSSGLSPHAGTARGLRSDFRRMGGSPWSIAWRNRSARRATVASGCAWAR